MVLHKFFFGVSAIEEDNITNPESVVAWLLEHPKIATSDSEGTSSIYESDTESVSYADGTGAQSLALYVSHLMHQISGYEI